LYGLGSMVMVPVGSAMTAGDLARQTLAASGPCTRPAHRSNAISDISALPCRNGMPSCSGTKGDRIGASVLLSKRGKRPRLSYIGR